MAPKNPLKLYQDVQIESLAHGGRRVDLVVVLYDHVVENLREARVFLEASNYLECGRRCSKALTILAGLRETLDFENGEPVASNLLKFYNVVTSKIIGAQSQKNTALLVEASGLVESVRSAWVQVSLPTHAVSSELATPSKIADASRASATAPSGAGVVAAV